MTKLIAFGDSIFAGWDGKENISASQRIPELIGQQLGWQVTNVAISGTKYDDSSNGFTAMVKKTNVSSFDYALVNYGVNNFSWPDSLDKVKQNAINGFDALKNKNPRIKILMELPTEDFRQGSTSLYDVNNCFWSQNQLDDMLVGVANQEGIDYYDWRPDPLITYDNANQTLGDGNTGVHPTPETMQKIADRLAVKLKQMADRTPVQPTQPTQPVQPTQPSNPSQPAKPVEPAYKDIGEVKFDRLSDLFGIGDNVDAGADRLIAKINEVYKTLHRYLGTDEAVTSKSYDPPGNELSRPLRKYVLLSFESLERLVNDLVACCNNRWIRDPKTGDKTDRVSLLTVDKLTLDDSYQDTINYNWYLIEQKVNALIGYINKSLKGE